MRTLIALLVFVAATLTMQASAQEAGGRSNVVVWEHPGADPYAASDDEAVTKLPGALLAMNATLTAKDLQGIPESARAKLIAAVAASPQGQDVIYITADMTLGAMMWKPTDVVKLNVTLPELPIVFEKRDGMYLSARARVWRVEDGGHVYVLYLPDICRNWSVDVVKATPPPPPPELCAEIVVTGLRAGDELHTAVLARGTISPSACWARKEGNGEWTVWPEECSECSWDNAQAEILKHRGATTVVRQAGKVTVTTTELTVRVPFVLVTRGDFFPFCITRDGQPSHERYVESSDFVNRIYRMEPLVF